MQKGNANGAIKFLSNNMQNGILFLNDTTLNHLKLKHPEAKKADEVVLLPDLPIKVHPVKFESIDAELVRKARPGVVQDLLVWMRMDGEEY